MKQISQKIKKLNHNPVAHSKYPEWNPVIEKTAIHSITVNGKNGEPIPFNSTEDDLYLVTAVLPFGEEPTVIGIEHEYEGLGEVYEEERDWFSVLQKYVGDLRTWNDDSADGKEINQYIDECVTKCTEAFANAKKEKLDAWQKELAERRANRKDKRRQKWVRTEEVKRKAVVKAIIEAKKAGASDTELAALQAQKFRECDNMLMSHKISDHDREVWLRSCCESIRIECEKV